MSQNENCNVTPFFITKINLWIWIAYTFRHLYPLWPWWNAGTPGHVCLSHSSWVPPRRARHIGTTLKGNFPQVDSGRGIGLPLCPRSASFSLRPCSLKSTNTHTLYLPSHTANSDIKPGQDVGILSLSFLILLSIIWTQALFYIYETLDINAV